MTINIKQGADKITVALEGRLDTTTAPKLQDALIPAIKEVNEVIVDFEGLEYISSAGLRILLMGEKESKAKSASMVICNVSSDVMEVLEMTGFDVLLTII